jgi:radical SAM protein with 4Fe4S-binding SPASM domain
MFFRLIREIEINPTELCNLTCNFCPRSTFYPNRNIHMTTETAEIIKQQLIDCGYDKVVSITGRGEPTLHPDFENFVKIFTGHKWKLKIHTNGKRFEKYKDFILSAFNEIHYNCYEHTQSQINEIYEKFKPYSNVTVVGKPKNEIWYESNHKYTNRAGSFPTNNLPEDKRCDIVFHKVFIDVDGTYRLCCEDWKTKVELGNVFSTSIKDYVDTSEELKRYRYDLANSIRNKQPCASCSYKVKSRQKNDKANFDKTYEMMKQIVNKMHEKEQFST